VVSERKKNYHLPFTTFERTNSRNNIANSRRGKQIAQNWEGMINILTAIGDEKYEEMAEKYLEDLIAYARLPRAEIEVCNGDFKSCLENAPRADLNIFGLADEEDILA
jgi:hypothetical protein